MKLQLIALKMNGKIVESYKLADISNLARNEFGLIDKNVPLKTSWFDPTAIVNMLVVKKIDILGLAIENMEIIPTNGGFNRYANLIQEEPGKKYPLIVLERVNIKGVDGAAVCDINGKVLIVSMDKLVLYAEKVGIANGKVVTNNGQKYISSIRGEYARVGAVAQYETPTVKEVKEDVQLVYGLKRTSDIEGFWPEGAKLRDEKTGLTAEEKIIIALKAIQNWNFFVYMIISSLKIAPIQPRYNQTMGVSLKMELVYNPHFVCSINLNELTFSLIHEAYHILFSHPARIEQHYKNMKAKGLNREFSIQQAMQLYNIAADLYVNKYIAVQFGSRLRYLVNNPHEVTPDDSFVTNKHFSVNSRIIKHIKAIQGGCYNDHVDIDKDTIESIFLDLLEQKRREREEERRKAEEELNKELAKNQSNNDEEDDDDEGSSGLGGQPEGSSGESEDSSTDTDDKSSQQSSNDDNAEKEEFSGTENGTDSEEQGEQSEDSDTNSGGKESDSEEQAGQSEDSESEGSKSTDSKSAGGKSEGSDSEYNPYEDTNTTSMDNGIGTPGCEDYSENQEETDDQNGSGGSQTGTQGTGDSTSGLSDSKDTDSTGVNSEDTDEDGEGRNYLDSLTPIERDERRDAIAENLEEYEECIQNTGDLTPSEGGLDGGQSNNSGSYDRTPAEQMEIDMTLKNWKQNLINAVTKAQAASQSRGLSLSKAEQRLIESIIKAVPVDWKTVLARMFNMAAHKANSYKRPSRRDTPSKNVILPGKVKKDPDGLQKVVFAVDTSGSVGDEELKMVLGMMLDLSNRYKVDIDVVWWSTRVNGIEQHIRSSKDFYRAYKSVASDGGTCCTHFFEWLTDRSNPYYKGKAPQGIVIFTDGYIDDVPIKYNRASKNIVWIIHSNPRRNFRPSFGTATYVDDITK